MSGRTRVKICGLTRLEDAERAIELGADALGFVFWPGSPRAVSPERAAGILRSLPPFPVRVGVFVNASPAAVARVLEAAPVNVVQLHGDERAEEYASLARPLIKAVNLDDGAGDPVDAIPSDVVPLVDAADAARRGGTGRTADWTRAAALASRRRIVLAGGLTADNVGMAISTVRPWVVDVSSGVERAPGIKDSDRLRAFFARVREAEMEDR
jgi:phosphoribosylanthranilate isomerase